MKKLISIILLLLPFAAVSAQTHNVYVHKAGIDTSIYNQPQTQPDFSQLNGLANKIKAKREVKKAEQRGAEYSLDLINSTNGLKDINKENIVPLIQKYPEKSEELLEMLRNSN